MSVEVHVPEPAQWVDRYGDELYRFALRRVGTADCAEELVQETLLSALDRLADFRGQASERSWLFVILKRKITDHYRRQARSPLVALEPSSPSRDGNESIFFRPEDGHWREAQYPQAWQVRADDALEQQELSQILQGCQQRLPAQHSAVFALRFVEEMSADEVCRELSLTLANYWVIVHRAKLQLRRCLEKHWFGAVTPAAPALR